MQVLTQAPRQGLTDAQVRGLLTGDSVTVAAGLELVDAFGNLVLDVSDDLVDGEVNRDNQAVVHGGCSLRIAGRVLAWGRDRVRPFMVLSDDDGTEARFNLGVYVLTSPEVVAGVEPTTYDVQGYDLLYLLQTNGPGDTYVARAGETYYQVVQGILVESGAGGVLILDGTLQDTAIPTPMVWALTEQPTTWLAIINDLLAAINYVPLWVDQEGAFRSGPWQASQDRAAEWTFNTRDQRENLVGEDRKSSADAWGVPNWWRFVRKNIDAPPSEGAGYYTVTNQSDGPTSVDALGRTVRKVLYLDAADQASLEASGDQVVAEDQHRVRTFELDVEPLPIAGHMDVVEYVDLNVTAKCQVRSWTLPLDGSPGKWTLEMT